MKKTLVVALTALAALSTTQAASAQWRTNPVGTNLSVEARVGAAFPTGDFADESDLDTGLSGALRAAFHFTPVFALYAGVSGAQWGFEEDFAEFGFGVIEGNLKEYGFDAGLKIIAPPFAGFGNIAPFLHGGAIFHRTEFDFDNEDLNDLFDEFGGRQSDLSLGFEVGAGLAFPLSPSLMITPGVRYLSFEPKFEESDEVDIDVSNLTYAALEIGLMYRF